VSARTPTTLERILQDTRAEIDRRKRTLPANELEDRALASRGAGDVPERGFRAALTRPGIGVIAEFKRRSPSAGTLRERADVGEVVSAYARGGASALSVLTEGPNFGGSLEDLRAARAACGLPILRKDFIVDSYQLFEAWAAGADAVLLIVAALERGELASLHDAARAIGLDVLVEVHDRAELRDALVVGADTIGINNRDLRDFSVDVGRTEQLIGEVPAGVTVVSESGIATAQQLSELCRAGVHAVLVGESLMRSPDPEAAVRALSAHRPWISLPQTLRLGEAGR
jgi:indole-3-glycerol phosphate synthase